MVRAAVGEVKGRWGMTDKEQLIKIIEQYHPNIRSDFRNDDLADAILEAGFVYMKSLEEQLETAQEAQQKMN